VSDPDTELSIPTANFLNKVNAGSNSIVCLSVRT
jgi:hypothetical protein